MKFVVKLGGAALEDLRSCLPALRQVPSPTL